MRRYILVAFSVHAFAAAPDAWFGRDKVKHFFLGAFVQSAGFGVLQAFRLSDRTALASASTITVGVAVAKELRDRSTGTGTPSLRDLAWGLAGCAAVSPLLLDTK